MGCYSTIGAAVMNARVDYIENGIIDTINVAPGTYKEDIIISGATPLWWELDLANPLSTRSA